jgi:rubrerythrin
MIYNLNADMVLEMAEEIEKDGAKFYKNAARRLTTASVKQTLLDLAAMEEEHEHKFARMRKELSEEEKRTGVSNLDPDIQRYLKALSASRVFFKKEKPAVKVTETHSEADIMRDIYRSAIRAEKDSIVFYVGLRELVPASFGRTWIDEIIQEEMRHITTLSVELAELKLEATTGEGEAHR